MSGFLSLAQLLDDYMGAKGLRRLDASGDATNFKQAFIEKRKTPKTGARLPEAGRTDSERVSGPARERVGEQVARACPQR